MSNPPSHRLPPLDLLVSFEAVARLGSITKAAGERFITQSAMSRQLQALEAELGTALFVRQHRALALTDAGRHLLATCTTVLAQVRETVAALRAPRARELLSLTTTPSFAALWLIPRLASFTQQHPGVDVRLDASYERRDLAREGFDIAVRYGPTEGATGLRLFGESLVPVCSPAVLARGPADLAQLTLLDLTPPPGLPVVTTPGAAGGMPVEWDSWLKALGLGRVQPRATLSFSNYSEAIAAAVAGHGVALGRRPLIDDLLRDGRLVVPFGDSTASARAYYLLQAPAAAARPAVQALVAWLAAQGGCTEATATGPGPKPFKRKGPAGGRSRASAPTG